MSPDIAGTSVEQSEGRYKEMLDRASHERRPQKIFKADFITADCTKVRSQPTGQMLVFNTADWAKLDF